MSDEDRLDVVLLWHMHQPQYADAPDRCYHLPWAYLHTIEDCVDMAAHLEAVPAARVVVNFAPTLLQQIDGRLDEPALGQAQQQLGICDGADWLWWFGPANPTESVRDFDALYRHHLANLYRLIDETAPTHLDSPFTFGGGAPAAGGVMRPGIHS